MKTMKTISVILHRTVACEAAEGEKGWRGREIDGERERHTRERERER